MKTQFVLSLKYYGRFNAWVVLDHDIYMTSVFDMFEKQNKYK